MLAILFSVCVSDVSIYTFYEFNASSGASVSTACDSAIRLSSGGISVRSFSTHISSVSLSFVLSSVINVFSLLIICLSSVCTSAVSVYSVCKSAVCVSGVYFCCRCLYCFCYDVRFSSVFLFMELISSVSACVNRGSIARACAVHVSRS